MCCPTGDLKSVAIEPANITLAVGGNGAIKTKSGGHDVTRAVIWSSDNTGIVTVDAMGNLTGVATGTATIMATSVADPTIEATCAVTVINIMNQATRVSYPTVEEAVNTADNGDTILVASGQYGVNSQLYLNKENHYTGYDFDNKPVLALTPSPYKGEGSINAATGVTLCSFRLVGETEGYTGQSSLIGVGPSLRNVPPAGGDPGYIVGNLITNTEYHFAITSYEATGNLYIENNVIENAATGGIFIYKNKDVTGDRSGFVEIVGNVIDT